MTETERGTFDFEAACTTTRARIATYRQRRPVSPRRAPPYAQRVLEGDPRLGVVTDNTSPRGRSPRKTPRDASALAPPAGSGACRTTGFRRDYDLDRLGADKDAETASETDSEKPSSPAQRRAQRILMASRNRCVKPSGAA